MGNISNVIPAAAGKAYSYDYVGNRLDMTVTDSGGTRVHVYSYDDIYQITEVNYPTSLEYLATDTTFAYDAAGNRTSVIKPALREGERGSGTSNYTSNTLNQYTAAGTTSFQYDNSGNLYRDGNYYYTYDPENRLTQVKKPNPPVQNLNNFSAYTQGGDANWVPDPYGFAESGSIGDDEESWMSIHVQGPGTVTFQWSVSSEQGGDYLRFLIDDIDREGISGSVDWESKSFTISGSTSHELRWRYHKNESESSGQDCGWFKSVVFTPDPLPEPDALALAVDSGLTYTTGGDAPWSRLWDNPYHGDSRALSGGIDDSQQSWMETTVSGAGTLKFWWKVSSEQDGDYLEFYVDNEEQPRYSISGTVAWQEKSYTVGSGSHTFRWRYVTDSEGSAGDDCGWVDWVQWNGSVAEPATTAWSTLNYVYDASGRRIEKKYDGRTVLKYLYDGDHCIAEYGAGNDLHRKYLYGPGVDQPIAMIESAGTYAGTYYYHCDGLGSVTALTNSSGNTVEVYEYDVYGRPGASVPAHPNRIMFTGREYDQETGLLYYRARYYTPQIGRFLQTDPVGYRAGMNLYRYCSNSPQNRTDPSGNEDEYKDNVFTDSTGITWNRQDCDESCVAASICNVLQELGYSMDERTVRQYIQKSLMNDNTPGDDAAIWGKGGKGVSPNVCVTALNEFLKSAGSTVRYELLAPGSWDVDTMKKRVTEGGAPVLYAVGGTSGPSAEQKSLDAQTMADRSPWHCKMLGTVANQTQTWLKGIPVTQDYYYTVDPLVTAQ